MFTTIQEEETRYDCLFFEKSITRRVRRRFYEANTVGVPCKRAQHCCATLRRSQNNRNVGTCWATSLTGFKLNATSANTVVVPCKQTQQVTTLLGPTMLGVVGQQCCVRLHGPLVKCCSLLRPMQTDATCANNYQQCWVLLANNEHCVCLHGPKSLTGFKLNATSANIVVVPCKWTQQVPTLLGPTILGVVGQQCWVRLHEPLNCCV